jgi:hypothetical protein
MEVRLVKGFVNALAWFIIGMTFMSRMYCINLDITSGPMYIGWDTVTIVVCGLLALKAILWFDPSFKE